MALPVKDEDGKVVACVQFINKLTEDGEASVEGFGACSELALTPLGLAPSCRRSRRARELDACPPTPVIDLRFPNATNAHRCERSEADRDARGAYFHLHGAVFRRLTEQEVPTGTVRPAWWPREIGPCIVQRQICVTISGHPEGTDLHMSLGASKPRLSPHPPGR